MKTIQITYRTFLWQKHPLLLLGLCLLVMCGCGNLYTGEETLFDPEKGEEPKQESVPVMVAFDDPYYNILSRGVGKIDPEDEYFGGKMNPMNDDGKPKDPKEKPRFFVYAFKRSNPFGYDVTRADDKEICLVDGSCGTQAEYAREYPEERLAGHGKWAYYNGNGSFVNWLFTDSDKLYYSDENQTAPYDFFAYYHDGAASGDIERTDDRISFPIKIDGSQDLMCGVAELTEEQIANIDALEDEESKQKLKEFYYSTYSGRHNIWPIFRMKHQLAYIKVNLVAGNAYGDPVFVHDIRLETNTVGNFIVVSKDKKIGATFDGSGVEQLPLRDVVNGKAILPGEDEPETTPNNPEDNPDAEGDEETPVDEEPTWKKRNIQLQYNEDGTCPPPMVAGELLVPPGNNLVLHTWLSNLDTKGEVEHTVLSLTDKIKTAMDDYEVNGVVAGKTYNLNLTVYGPKEISIEVKATPWKNGGDINVDIEDDRQD